MISNYKPISAKSFAAVALWRPISLALQCATKDVLYAIYADKASVVTT